MLSHLNYTIFLNKSLFDAQFIKVLNTNNNTATNKTSLNNEAEPVSGAKLKPTAQIIPIQIK